MFSVYHDLTKAQATSSADAEQGWLEVEVPQWTAQVRIYDGRFLAVPSVGMVKEHPPGTKRYVSETVLAAGTYKVEVTADGLSKSDSVRVRPGQLTRVSQDPGEWESLGANCAAPLANAASHREWQTEPAVEWSRKATWKKFANSGSRLFLFVRTLQPEKYKKFAKGLSLWDAEGNPVTDFRAGVEIDAQKGWLAFCADLPAGGYVIRRGRSGVRLRHQPIYLCEGWETQIFLLSKGSPSLRRSTINMARYGAGFRDDDESAVAAQAIFDGLMQDTGHLQLAMSEKMNRLLEGKFENPWFGILATCMLMLVQEEALERPTAEVPAAEDAAKINRLLQKGLGFLSAEVGEHPDVRALQLKEDEPPREPFPFPPLLWRCLRRVQRHGTRFADTIPLGSLTDSIVGNFLSDSPWTAWRKQGLPLKIDRTLSLAAPHASTAARLAAKAKGLTERVERAILDFNAPAVLAQTAQPKFVISRLDSQTPKAVWHGSAVVSADEPMSSAPPPGSLAEVPLIQLVKYLVEKHELSDLPEKIVLNVGRALEDILEHAESEVKKISTASGLPLSRVENALQRLRRQSEEPEQLPKWVSDLIGATTQTVLQYALLNDERRDRLTTPGVSSAAESDAADDEQTSPAEAATQIRVAANRLSAVVLGEEGQARSRSPSAPLGEHEKAQVKQLFERLSNLADLLLDTADFVAVTTREGRIIYGNSAFLSLLSHKGATAASGRHSKEMRKLNRRVWENILAQQDAGQTQFDDPTGEGSWALKRTAIEDESSGELYAYLNGLWREGVQPAMSEAVVEIQELLPSLTLHTSVFSYSTGDDRNKHLGKIGEITSRLEQLTNAVEPAERLMMETTHNEASGGAQPDDPELKMPRGTLYGREFWGISRHKLIAGAADRLLSTRARAEVERILEPIETVSLADIAAWADEIKRRRPDRDRDDPETFKFLSDPRNSSQPIWHYVNIPNAATRYSRTLYPAFTRDNDVVQMIRASVKVLKKESDRFSELNALRLLTHLIGDVHQPVHVGCGYIDESGDVPLLVSDPNQAQGLESDSGGNDLILPIPGGVSLHSYWDSRLPRDDEDHSHDKPAADAPAADAPASDAPVVEVTPELERRFIEKLARRVKDSAAAADTVPEGPIEDWAKAWATRSLKIAKDAYEPLRIVSKQGNKYKVEWESKEAYDNRFEPVVRRQTDGAARHLADLLNAIWE
jgi:PAS domain-containing protein